MSRPSGTRAAGRIPTRARGAYRRRRRRRRHHRPSARGPAAHHRRGHRPADGRDRPAAEPRDGGDRGDAGDRARPPAARRLHRPRAARGAHHGRRARRRGASTTISPTMSTSSAPLASASACSSSRPKSRSTAAVRLGAPVVEFHTGRYAHCRQARSAPPNSSASPIAPRWRSRTASSRTPATASPSTMSPRSPPSRSWPSSTSAISWSARRSSPASTPASAKCAS